MFLQVKCKNTVETKLKILYVVLLLMKLMVNKEIKEK